MKTVEIMDYPEYQEGWFWKKKKNTVEFFNAVNTIEIPFTSMYYRRSLGNWG